MKVIFRIPNKGTAAAPNYSNPSPIVVRGSKGNIQVTASTGFEVDPKYWILPDHKKKMKAIAKAAADGTPAPKFIVTQGLAKNFKPQKLSKDEINRGVKVLSTTTLDELSVKIKKAFEVAYANGVTINSAWLKDIILEFRGQRKSDDESLFSTHFKHYIDKEDAKRLQPILDRINEFDKKLHLKDINADFSKKYGKWIRKNGYRPGYILQELSVIRRVLRDAEKRGHIISKIYTKDWFKPTKTKEEKNFKVIYLSEKDGEIAAIENLDLSHDPIHDNARNVLLLSCYTGQRYSDLGSLKYEDIDDEDTIEFTQVKTNRQVVVPIVPEAKAILKKGIKLTHLSLYVHRVKEVCRLAGINTKVKGRTRGLDQDKTEYKKWELISSHSGRRSFASNNYDDMPIGVLMSITGHTKEETFFKYIGRTKKDGAKDFLKYKKALKKMK